MFKRDIYHQYPEAWGQCSYVDRKFNSYIIVALGLREQNGVLGRYLHDGNPINVARARLIGARLFVVVNLCLAYRSPCTFPAILFFSLIIT